MVLSNYLKVKKDKLSFNIVSASEKYMASVGYSNTIVILKGDELHFNVNGSITISTHESLNGNINEIIGDDFSKLILLNKMDVDTMLIDFVNQGVLKESFSSIESPEHKVKELYVVGTNVIKSIIDTIVNDKD